MKDEGIVEKESKREKIPESDEIKKHSRYNFLERWKRINEMGPND